MKPRAEVTLENLSRLCVLGLPVFASASTLRAARIQGIQEEIVPEQVVREDAVREDDDARDEPKDENEAKNRLLEDERKLLERRLRLRVRDVSRQLEIGQERAFALMDAVPTAVDQWLRHDEHPTPERQVIDFSGKVAPIDSPLEPVLDMPAWTAVYARLSEEEQDRYTRILADRRDRVRVARSDLVMAILEARLFLSPDQARGVRPHVERLVADSSPESTQSAIDRLIGRHPEEMGELLSERQFRRLRYSDSVPHSVARRGRGRVVDRKSLELELDLAVDYIAATYGLESDGVALIRDATRRGIECYKTDAFSRTRGMSKPEEKQHERAVDEILADPILRKLLATVASVEQAERIDSTLEAQRTKRRRACVALINAQLIDRFGLEEKKADSLVPLLERGMKSGAGRAYRPQIESVDLSPIKSVPIFIGRSGITAMKDVLDDDQDKELDSLVERLPMYMIREG